MKAPGSGRGPVDSTLNDAKGLNPLVFRRLLNYLKPYRILVMLSALGLVFATAGELLGPVVIQNSMDRFILPVDDMLSKTERMDGLILWGRYFLLVLILSFSANFIQIYFSAMAGQKVMKDVRSQLFEHLMKQSLKYLGDTPVGSLVSRVTSDVETVNELFTTVALALMKDLALMSGALLTLFLLNVPLAWITLGTIPPVIILTLVVRKRIRQVYRETQHQTSRINAFLSESLVGMHILQLFGRRNYFRESFKEKNEAYYKVSMREMYTYSFFRPFINLLTSVSVGTLIYFGAGLHNKGVVTLGILIAFIHLIEKFYAPIMDIADKITILQSAMAGGERVFQILDRDEAIPDQGQQNMKQLKGEVDFKNVHFRYKEEPILKGVSFKIKPGEMVAVVGTTGAGKTTLANLMTRFWDVESGKIELDGVDIRSLALDNLRTLVQTVQQDVTLFSGSLRENITLGRDFPEHRIKEALSRVRADHFIDSLPDGLDTELTEGAGNLSFGQRQLISFARIFLFDPALVILDEATSNIDTETESWIQQGMEELLEDRTSMVIAHRLSTIARADRILVMSRGELVEEGTHRQLMSKEGIYYNLYRLQYKE